VSPKDWTIRLEDMIDAAEKVSRYTQDMADLNAFSANEVIVDAVLRNVQIIGEAARHVPDAIQAHYPDVDWSGMRGMRNILVHNYGRIELQVVWGVVQTRVPPLIPRLREILQIERSSPTTIDP
jgi:uncharacterized protein with HEPN domain